MSHDATSKEYVIVNSGTGWPENAIVAAGKDYTQLKNLKITGQIDSRDFYFMRDSMNMLRALNLKEVRIKSGFYNNTKTLDDQIPGSAFIQMLLTPGKRHLLIWSFRMS